MKGVPTLEKPQHRRKIDKVIRTSCVSMAGTKESHNDEKLYCQLFQSILQFLNQEIMGRLIVPSKLIFRKTHSSSAVRGTILSSQLGYM